MARKRKSGSRSSSRSSRKSARPGRFRALLSDRERLLSTAGAVTTVVLVAGVVVGLVLGRGPMRKRVDAIRSQPVRVSFEWPRMPGASDADGRSTTWLDRDSQGKLESIAESWLKAPAMDERSLAAAHEALMKTGWFRGDCSLRRHADGTVRITGRWRVPTAVVRCGGLDRLVSLHGERLPPEYPVDTSGRKVIIGTNEKRIPALGEPWPDGGVQPAIDLLGFLAGIPGYDQVYGVDVSDFARHKQLVLVTEKGNRILWGGPIDKFNPGQAPAEKKRLNLQRVYERYGRIDADSPYIDVSLERSVQIDERISPGPPS